MITEPDDQLAANLSALASLYNLKAYLQRMQINLNLIKSQGGQVVYVTNANLFRLAVTYYDNALMWTTIAIANGLNDPHVYETTALIIPPIGHDTGGFIAP